MTRRELINYQGTPIQKEFESEMDQQRDPLATVFRRVVLDGQPGFTLSQGGVFIFLPAVDWITTANKILTICKAEE